MANPIPQPTTDIIEPPDVSGIVIEDGEPVDGIYAEKQQRLLTEPLYASWPGPPGEAGERRPFVATSNVGLFASPNEPPLVPDALLSVDVQVRPDFMQEKRYGTYFNWEMGKPPEVAIEVVSNREGDELGKRKRGYARMRVAYYVVWDPLGMLSGQELVAFELKGDLYVALTPVVLPSLGLALVPWNGSFEGVEGRWLRWHADGALLPTGAERAEAERTRADAECERADAERERAERLEQLLREHGIPTGANDKPAR